MFKKVFILYLISSLFLASCNNVNHDLNVSPVFSDQMVLQQAQSNPIWGTSSPDSEITITSSWGESVITKADSIGHWTVQLPTPIYKKDLNNKKQTLYVSNSYKTIVIKDVLIGEVWLASGQSNMQWYMDQCEGCIINQKKEIENSKNELIRMFSVPQDLTGETIKSRKWIPASAETTGKFSATAYYFAKKLFDKLGVPIGIVNTSWGGTRVEAWMSPEKLKTLDETKKDIPLGYSFLDFQTYFKKYNDSIAKFIGKKYGYKTLELPKLSDDKKLWSKYAKEWEELDLGDKTFMEPDFDDSSWENWNPNLNNYTPPISKGRFEAVFEDSDKLLSDGIIWYRVHVTIPDSTKNYVLKIKKGIDDGDQTYFNGKLIGNTYGHYLERSYTIPKEIIKKDENLISFRITDPGGGGGFNSPVELHEGNNVIQVPFESFKFKHHSFITNNNNIIVHNHSTNELKSLSQKNRDDIIQGFASNDQNGFSAMYECMLTPVMPYGIKGVIWYQGEQNVKNYHEYTNLFSGMIEDWRSAWSSDLPFYFAQIAPYIYDKNESSQGLRDAQRKTLDRVEKTGMAVLLDIGEENDIHPENKKDVGERLALHALKNQYNFNLIANGPLYKNHVRKGSRIEVSFNHIANGLVSNGKLTGFEVAGNNSVFHPAKAVIANNKIIVFSDEVMNPVHVRYGWKNWFEGKLFNSEGLPASSFSSQ
jgi:sialate O-acetylesterase